MTQECPRHFQKIHLSYFGHLQMAVRARIRGRYSSLFEVHLRALGQRTESVKPTIGSGSNVKVEKCYFFNDRIDYLGHVIRPGRF